MRRGLLAFILVALFVALPAAPAGAIVEGPCGGTVNGINAAGLPVDDPSHAIKVPEGGTVTYVVQSPVIVRSRSFVLSFAGVDITVDSGSSSRDSGGGDRRGDTIAVDDYAWMGAGLYQVAGVAHLESGATCSGAVLIDVGGNPLTTVAGITGLILVVLGAAGVITGAIRRGGGRLVKDLVDLIELGGFDDIVEVAAGSAGAEGEPVKEPVGKTDAEAPAEEPATEPPPDETKRRRRPPVTVTTAPPDVPVTAPPVPVGGGHTPPTNGNGNAKPDAKPESEPEAEAAKPPPLPGMATVSAVGAGGKSLTEAAGQLEEHIDSLPISDEQKEKLKETLGIDKIKEKLESVTEVTDTIEHFEAMGTETVDSMNRWGVNSNGANGLIWLRTMFEATGRLGQKFTDGLVKPVIEPVAEAAGKVGVEVDADEVAHTLLPVQDVAEEASKALLTASKNVLGGDNILGQLGQDPVVDEEWRAIRSFQ